MNRNISLASRDPLPLGREDIYKGMEEIGAYLDVTPRDFQEIYAHAYKIARGRLLSSITAGDIMHVPVLCVAEEQSVRDLVIFLDDHRISGAPVVGAEGRLSGVVSESDIVRFVGGGETVTVMHLMHTLMRQGCVSARTLKPRRLDHDAECVSVGEGAHLGDMLELLRTRRINRIPVVDAGMRPVGIVSRTDIINAFGVMQ
ncbi:MAG: CBS domain-containing protein [Bilophila wadsworthia]